MNIKNDLKSISHKENSKDFNESINKQIMTSRRLTKANLQFAAAAALKPHESSTINESKLEGSSSSLGYLRFNVEYISSLLQLKIYLISAASLPAKDSNGLSDPYVKIHLLPGIAKVNRAKKNF